MTYRHGEAPADAPVTWLLIADKHGLKWQLSDGHGWICIAHSEELAERTARAFHWAKLYELMTTPGGLTIKIRPHEPKPKSTVCGIPVVVDESLPPGTLALIPQPRGTVHIRPDGAIVATENGTLPGCEVASELVEPSA